MIQSSFSSPPSGLQRALEAVRKILDQNKNPLMAADVDHSYIDKYSLVESMTNTGIAAIFNVLQHFSGINEEVLRNAIIVVQDQKRSMNLRLTREEDCDFIEEITKSLTSPTSQQFSVKSPSNNEKPINETLYTHRTITDVKEYHWKAGIRHTLTLFAGTDPTDGMAIGKRLGTTRLVTAMKKPPFPPQIRSPVDLELTWIMNQINRETLEASFKINRSEAKTPCRNKQTSEALTFLQKVNSWLGTVLPYFQQTIWRDLLSGQTDHCSERLSSIKASNIFVPVAPLFMEKNDLKKDDSNNDENNQRASGLVLLPPVPTDYPLIPTQDTNLFLNEQSRSLQEALSNLLPKFPDPNDTNNFVSGYEAKLVLLCLHLQEIAKQLKEGIIYVEQMLYSQLVSAVGKEVKAKDFDEFLRFHNQRLFGMSYSPKPFCYAIRQPNEYPDGVLSFVTGSQSNSFFEESSKTECINTFSRCVSSENLFKTMSIPLDAATTVDFVGDQYLHGWLDTQFEGEVPAKKFISARARQFSCFLLIIGNLSGPNQFTPKDAILLQNKDEVLIPLLTSSLPSAKEFKDAIRSLSPEQASFAKSIRAMQLDSSVFGVCVIQVRPQMEALLNLPPGSLMKEIRLTQDLLSLFSNYQIPPNLVSYDGEKDVTASEKVSAVKQHVKSVLDVIEGMKEEQLGEEVGKAVMGKVTNSGFSFTANPPAGGLFGASAPCPSPKMAPAGGSFGAPAPCPSPKMAAAAAYVPCSAQFSAQATATNTASVHLKSSAQLEEEYVSLDNLNIDQADDLLDGTTEKEQSDSLKTLSTNFTTIPKKLDRLFESFDRDGALRTMTIKTGNPWVRKQQENLLTTAIVKVISSETRKTETDKALDLLDALSRSGSLPVASGELHVVIGVRHRFERSVMATVIADNMNPVEKVDWSSLLIGSTVHQVNIQTLLEGSVERPTNVLNNREFPTLMFGDR